MKNRHKREKPYQKLINKMFWQTLAMMLLAIVMVLLVSSAGRGNVGNFITRLISETFWVDWSLAADLYWGYVRRNLDYILIAIMVVLFLVFFRLLLSWFTKYFDQIIAGVNQLTGSRKEKISMLPELEFMADKLNQVQDELERSLAAEREAEKRKNDLIVYLAHDIKTPLTSVVGYLDLLDGNADISAEERNKYIHIAREKSYRLEKLINEFFEIARYNLATVPLHKEEIDLCYMFVQITDEVYPLLTANNKMVSLHLDDELRIYADAEKLARLFNNLLKNAITYSEADSSIVILGHKHKDNIVLRFINAGTIPADKLPFVFDKFYRVDEARQTMTGGAGLGLAIAKDIVSLHNGSIQVACQEGKTIFTVILPQGLPSARQ